VLVVALGQIHNRPASLKEQLLAVGMRGHHRAVAGQREAERLGEAVHRIGREHAGTRAAGGAGGTLVLVHVRIAHPVVGGHDHGVNQVHGLDDVARQLHLAGFHGSTGDKDSRDVEPQRGHQHAGGDLIAVGDADQRVGAVGVGHVLHRVGDQLARGQRVQHAVVAHGNAVVDGDGVEFLGDAAGFFDLAGDHLAQVLEVYVAGDKLGKGVGDGDDRLAKIAILHTGCAPKRAGSGHVASMRRGAGTISGHFSILRRLF